MLIDLAFDKPLDMYKLIVEVARYNSFTPFEFLAGGSATPATAG
jgi:pyridoxal biosynthesis lyase PdxS